MSFTELATKIIKDSIVSTVYIDDNIVVPFEAKSEINSSFFDVSNGLYQSFKKENKSIDFYRFTKGNDLDKDSDYIFKNRDLLILDWHLDDPNSLRQPLTMNLLKKAIFTDNLHFVSIYTQSEAKDFDDIFYSIKAYFETGYNGKIQAVCDIAFQEIEVIIDFDISQYFSTLASEIKQLSLYPSTIDEKYKELKDKILSKLGKDAYKVFANFIKNIAPDNDSKRGCEIFGYFLNKEDFGLIDSSNNSMNYKFIGENFIVINHTIIQITNKKEPSPVNHFNFFSEALLNVCGNLLTLTSLEIRNLLRDSSGFIGKDADSINEAALFHHQSQKKNFFDFIVDIWKSHTLSFLDYNSDKLNTLNKEFWKEYQTENKVSDKLDLLIKNETQFHLELAKLNVYYNSLHLSNKTANDKIKFGDVFLELDSNARPNGKYWLNITAHCDCNEPLSNLKNNFYFISGEKGDLKKCLGEGDSGFNSFINTKEEIIPIKWNSKPVVLNIPISNMEEYIINSKDGVQKDIQLKYIGTLKENYTQRMANNSFSFAMRVGIDFASI